MLKSSAQPAIRLRGVRHNNLKNFDLDLPLNQFIVITGLSGSGKSSLAFDTLFAEGQRRYIETFSPYARQFFDRMDKPQADSIEGIPPAIAIEQRNAVRTTRSTVGTMTEICDYLKLLWPHVAQLHCRQCGQPVRKDSAQSIWEFLQQWLQAESGALQPGAEGGSGATPGQAEWLITFDLPLSEKLSLTESLALVSKQGYQRLLVDNQPLRLEEVTARSPRPTSLTVVQDRLNLGAANRARFIEACEQAYHFGKGKLALRPLDPARPAQRFSNRLHCARCDLEYRDPSPALFSFNHPVGACPTCRGFGRTISIDYDRAVPDRSKTLAQGVVKPWQTGLGAECQADLLRMCRRFDIPLDVPFDRLPRKWQNFVVEGEPGYGQDAQHQWPHAWYGVKGYFRWLESRAYKMHVRVLLSRYRAYTPCPDCQGKRFRPETLLYRCEVPRAKAETRTPKERPSPAAEAPEHTGRAEGERGSLTLADFYQLPIRDALDFVAALAGTDQFRPNQPLGIVLDEVRSRLGYLNDVGLGYLTLDRPTRSLSGGETERVNLTTCLGTRLVNTLFVLDEPSVGLHPRDTARLVRILQQLRQAGNTVLVVEHEPSVMRAADQIVDLGPGHGATGGEVVFQGSYARILKAKTSLTGQYLSGRKQIPIPPKRPVKTRQASRLPPLASLVLKEASRPFGGRPSAATGGNRRDACATLKLAHATRHNLRDLAVEIPLGRFVCVTGVSGSGKTTLIREVLLPALAAKLKSDLPDAKASDRLTTDLNGEEEETTPGTPQFAAIEGAEHLGRVVLVDQSILGKTPRSNPAVYIGAFDDIREFYAQSELAKQRGLNASAFSFNSAQGQCERCRGAGFEKIEMQFLSDVFIRCPDCNGRRYRTHIQEIKIRPAESEVQSSESKVQSPRAKGQGPKSKGQSLQSSVASGKAGDSALIAPSEFSIADLLEATVEEASAFLAGFPESRPARRAVAGLALLEEVGLGYLKLGQPINTLSGGESQRLKLVRHLAEAITPAGAEASRFSPKAGSGRLEPARPGASLPALFLFDEPTTGLHFADVAVLLKVFQRLVDAGHSVVVIEHNLEVIKSADWIIDLGPDAGDRGGQIVVQGTPEEVARCAASFTGQALKESAEK